MKLQFLMDRVRDKNNFKTLEDYSDFCKYYLEFIHNGLQAVIVSQNENNYRFLQYKADGNFTVTRPINSDLMLSVMNFDDAHRSFNVAIKNIRDIRNDVKLRALLNQYIYTCSKRLAQH